MKKFLILVILSSSILACSQKDNKADMYEASPMSQLMRRMVVFSKRSKAKIEKGDSLRVPKVLYELPERKGTRDEHKDSAFQQMARTYLNTLKGIERGDSQAYYYQESINACKNCHSTYCGGPMKVINKLDLD
jgi:hypothetical protein